MPNKITTAQVDHIAKLANIPISLQEKQQFATDFTTTLDAITNLQKIDVTNVEPTHQVTGLENIFREDEVKEEQMFTQKQALANGANTYQGYFVVGRIIDEI